MSSTWRDIARPIINKIVSEMPEGPERNKALKDAYPFGARMYHPYKVWLDEIKVQTKKKIFGKKNNIVPKEQKSLFE